MKKALSLLFACNSAFCGIWGFLGALEARLQNPDYAPPIGLVGFFVILMFYGGFFVVAFLCGLLASSPPGWKTLGLMLCAAWVGLQGLYLLFYALVFQQNVLIFWHNALILSLQQTAGLFCDTPPQVDA